MKQTTMRRRDAVKEEGEYECGPEIYSIAVAVDGTASVALPGGAVGAGVGNAGNVASDGVVFEIPEESEDVEAGDYDGNAVVVVVLVVLVMVVVLVFDEPVVYEQAAHPHRHNTPVHNTQSAHPLLGAWRRTRKGIGPRSVNWVVVERLPEAEWLRGVAGYDVNYSLDQTPKSLSPPFHSYSCDEGSLPVLSAVARIHEGQQYIRSQT